MRLLKSASQQEQQQQPTTTNVVTRSRNSNKNGLNHRAAITHRMFLLSIFFFIVATTTLSPVVSAENSVGCNIDPGVCDQSEFCLNDNVLGICMSRDDQPIQESLRSEALFYNTEEDRAPIRIHKYNIVDEDDENVEYDQQDNSNELVDIKRDNIKDNYMDLERINLYSEKTKRSKQEPRTLSDLLNMASLSDMPREEEEESSNGEDDADEYFERDLDLSNAHSDDLEDYNYDDVTGLAGEDENINAPSSSSSSTDNMIDLLFEAPSASADDDDDDNDDDVEYSSTDYDADNYETASDYDEDERSKRSVDLVDVSSPGLILDSEDNLILKPVLVEAVGVDENGNSVYEKELSVNGVGVDTSSSESPLSSLDTKELGQMINNLRKENDFIEEVIKTAEVSNEANSPIEAELDKEIEKELTEQDLEEAVEQNEASSLDEALNSAMDKFMLDLKKGDTEVEEVVKKDVSGVSNQQQQQQHREQSQDPSAYSDSDLGKSGHFAVIDRSYVTIRFSDNINYEQAVDLLDYISRKLHLPLESFEEFSLQDDNSLSFKFQNDQVTSEQIADSIKNLRQEIQADKGLSIDSCGIGKKNNQVFVEKQLLSFVDPKSEKFILITIVSCLSLVLVILVLLVVFLVRRRSQLKAKLASDLTSGKYDFQKVSNVDEESLISGGGSSASSRQSNGPFNRFWLLTYIPFVGRNTTDKCHPKSADQDYQDLCRMRMQKGSAGGSGHGKHGQMSVNTSSEIHSSSPALVSPVAGPSAGNMNSTPIRADGNNAGGSSSSNNNKSDSTRSSTSSWSEEPINSVNMDITTGHVILSYMEEHLNEKNRLAKEWDALSQYEPDLVKCDAGKTPQNMTKNRYSNILPYDHTRVKLTENKDNDYINANFIVDDDPKNPAYIATQGPLIHTTSDFWQMVWEQGSVLIISLCRTVEYGSLKCNQFWPANGYELYDKFEIHLVSEHVWCEDYLVRNFFLKNLETSQTRTVTQFHFLTWPENGIPSNIKSILDFRRKVNKSYKGKSSPIIVHCNDGVGRTGTYVLIDMVLNKITKGAKEIDLAATLEFLRDQRFGMVKNKSQFEFSFAVVTEEVQNMLKALNHP